jgi:hypothetical protein
LHKSSAADIEWKTYAKDKRCHLPGHWNFSAGVGAQDFAHSVGSQMQQVFTGAPPDHAMHFYIGGLVLAILGVAQFFWKRK